MERDDIKALLELYFEGQTTLQQEQALSNYFLTESNLPSEFAPYKAIFGAFASDPLVTCNIKDARKLFDEMVENTKAYLTDYNL
jgi:hypothetical protein